MNDWEMILDFHNLIHEYAMQDKDRLTKDAIELKMKVINHIRLYYRD